MPHAFENLLVAKSREGSQALKKITGNIVQYVELPDACSVLMKCACLDKLGAQFRRAFQHISKFCCYLSNASQCLESKRDDEKALVMHFK